MEIPNGHGGALDALLAPRTIALVGASERPDSPGHALWNNLASFPGSVFPVHPAHRSVFGRPCAPRVSAIGQPVDLAIVVAPARTVPETIADCARTQVRAALILTPESPKPHVPPAQWHEAIRSAARPARMRILGPSALGILIPSRSYHASLLPGKARPGNVAFLTQSAALCASVLDWSQREHVGFSGVVSMGSMIDVGWGDLIDYFGDDPHTRSIVLCMGPLGDARRFLSAAREVALAKPVIAIKTGRGTALPDTHSAASYPTLHQGDEVLDAAFRRVGILRVPTLAELFDMAETLGKQPRPAGPRLAILTNALCPGVLANDALLAAGGEPAALNPESLVALESLGATLDAPGSPIDLRNHATPETFASALETVAADPGNDGVLVILTPQWKTDPMGTAKAIRKAARPPSKPVLVNCMGGRTVEGARRALNEAGFPTTDYPDAAAAAFCHMWRYSYHLRSLYETPLQDPAAPGDAPTDRGRATVILDEALHADRTLLTEVESKAVLASYGIPVVPTQVALSASDAVKLANRIGYPVVVKLFSQTLTHKTEVGGVQLNLGNPVAVREAWRSIETHVIERAHRNDFLGVTVQPMVVHNGCELLLGSRLDLDFGPVLVFGTGGPWTDVFRDRALALPPLTHTLALRWIEQTRAFQGLRAQRTRRPVNLPALQSLLVRFSYLVLEQPRIAEIDINPLIADADTLAAADARIVLHPPGTDLDSLPRPAIRPYPSRYVLKRSLKDGTPVVIRPILPEDEPRIVAFHKTLSDRSVYNRYFVPLKLSERIAHERLVRVCFSDYDREIPLVTEFRPAPAAPAQIIGIGRLSKEHLLDQAEFAIVISDAWQGRGLGRQLLELLIQIARDEKLPRLFGHILVGNREMQHVCRKLGFRIRHRPGDSDCLAELPL
ncbi:MAG: bifunctional acetate--CoA ligase family protein/GNAT family N-acetyltransferase [Verrucomicrobiae bacterium]|nr:bifunctional acetate--CoA ligase family protein/GNAT family N-acetyltransferase [Verrucomicrobiae bacterium]